MDGPYTMNIKQPGQYEFTSDERNGKVLRFIYFNIKIINESILSHESIVCCYNQLERERERERERGREGGKEVGR